MAVIFPIGASTRINSFRDEVTWTVLSEAVAAEWGAASASNPYALRPDMKVNSLKNEITVGAIADYFKTFTEEPSYDPLGAVNVVVRVNGSFDALTLANMLEYLVAVDAITPPWGASGTAGELIGIFPYIFTKAA